MMNYTITLKTKCETCDGTGVTDFNQHGFPSCPDCLGDGFLLLEVTLVELKQLLAQA